MNTITETVLQLLLEKAKTTAGYPARAGIKIDEDGIVTVSQADSELTSVPKVYRTCARTFTGQDGSNGISLSTSGFDADIRDCADDFHTLLTRWDLEATEMLKEAGITVTGWVLEEHIPDFFLLDSHSQEQSERPVPTAQEIAEAWEDGQSPLRYADYLNYARANGLLEREQGNDPFWILKAIRKAVFKRKSQPKRQQSARTLKR